jgi:hypothetical protein
VFLPPDGDSKLAHDGQEDTGWALGDYAEGYCDNQPNYADPKLELTVRLHRPARLDALGALSEASARTEGISDTGREVRTRLFVQPFRSNDWQLLEAWSQQDNGQFGVLSLERGWRKASQLPSQAIQAVMFEVATVAFSNCDNDVVGRAWGDAVLFEVLLGGRDALPGDVNLDGKVDLIDFAIVRERFGEDFAEADLDGSGTVDLTDFDQVKSSFGNNYALPAPVPEPSGALLAGAGLVLLVFSRRVRLGR